MKEQRKYEIIKKLVESNGNKKRAALTLGCSVRTINRLIIRYKSEGKAAFVHGNKGRAPAKAFSPEQHKMIIDLYKDKYCDTNLRHFCEIVNEELDISISDTTVNRWLRSEMIISPKAKRRTKKNLNKLLKDKLKETTSEAQKNTIKSSIDIIDSSLAHPRRPRSKYMGEMIQMDASEFYWINGGIKWHLHVAIDDASGEVVGAYFDTQETLKGYYNVLYQILTNYGIPYMFYTDRRTVFEYKRKNTLSDEDDTFTQFSYACNELGIDIKTTSVAQAKGRVERLNQTLQSRLPVELRRANIQNIEQANEFLPSYLRKFNKQFALHLNVTKSVFEQQPSEQKINETLAIICERTLDQGNCVKYKKEYYQPIKADGEMAYYRPKSKFLMIEAFDGTLYMSNDEHLYLAKKVEKIAASSKNFDDQPAEKPKRKGHIPPLNHPWRHSTFTNYRNKQVHRYAEERDQL